MTSPPDPESSRNKRLWVPHWPVPVNEIMSQQRRGGSDPTYKVDFQGRHWRGIRTPEGVTTLMVETRPREGRVYAAAWGEGSDWALEALPALLGAEDDPSGFEPKHQVLIDVWRQHRHWRIGRTGLVLEALVPSIIEQKVTGQEAFAGFRNLVHRWGNRAPGPGHDLDVWVQPDEETLRSIPSWEWLKLHVDPGRSKTVVTAARVAHAVERTAALTPADAGRALRSLPGHRGVDQRGGPAARVRRPGRRLLRRLPRVEGHRLGADRHRVRRRRARRVPGALPPAPVPRAGTGRPGRGSTGRGWGRGCRRAPISRS